jgi:hypothetical protein
MSRKWQRYFLSQDSTRAGGLLAAYANRDFKRMAATAHSMKSTVSYMGLHDELNGTFIQILK